MTDTTTSQQPHVVGAALVVGAGIGGMQAAVDMANAGLKVYLIESQTAIGGHMARLDKTFPTNDCAMCIMSPKLVECGRHLNIEILTGAELEAVEGQAGDFTVSVRQRPRFVDMDKCTACGDCATACPISLPDAFNAGLAPRKAAYKLYPQATPNAFAIDKRGTAPCRHACPTHQRAQGYVALIREGRFEDAYRVIKRDNPFPSVCGRICNHRCEDECSRARLDEPVSIMALKRFVVDWAFANGGSQAANGRVEIAPDAKQVAIVGAGPAGMTAAQDLALLGHRVTVFEALPVAGGMMRAGVPAYRLPPELVQREIDDILALGVELKLNHRVEDVGALLDDGFEAVFVAIGSHAGRKLPIPGADLPDVLLNTDFLRAVNLAGIQPAPATTTSNQQPATSNQQPVSSFQLPASSYDFTGRRVLVLGGGNVAVDVARVARRLGAASVAMSCLESRQQMPAHEWEIAEAEEEGIELYPSRTFKEVTSEDGRVTGVRCVEVDFRGFVEGRPDMDERPGTEHVLPADVVIFAIGQGPDLSCLGDDGALRTTRQRTVEVDPDTLATGRPGIFAGGDAVTGVGFVVEAIAAGHKAARSIDRYLRGEQGVAEPVLHPKVELSEAELAEKVESGQAARRGRVAKPQAPVAERVRDFREVDLALTEEQARAEAERCLACGVCAECLECVRACQPNAIDHDMVEQRFALQVGAIVLCPGVSFFDPRLKPEYGYGRYPNVMTSMEFERILSASGPYMGHVQRPSDGQEPRRIAWLQCIGSRDVAHAQEYCSSICCMQAFKEAIIAREHLGDIEPTIFFLDVRAFGKDFDRYVERAQNEYGVRIVRSFVSSLKEVPGSHDLIVRYAGPDGRTVEEAFDLVILSVGLRPSEGSHLLAERVGLQFNEYGFCQTPEFAPARTTRPGVYVAGAFREPKDIPETVIEASCAAAYASQLLAPARGTLVREKEFPPEKDVADEPERLGVFICHCGINIGSVVDVPAVVDYVSRLPGVVHAEHNLYTCSQDTQGKIREVIEEHGLNRVVVASCTPRTHESLFRDTIREAGLNPFLFEMTNIREQDSWVHRELPDLATRKAKELIGMAVVKARMLRPVHRPWSELIPSALVIGGGIAGMAAALSIAGQGYEVHLVERENELGGHLRHVYYTVFGEDAHALLRETVDAIESNPLVHVHLGATVAEVGGYLGRYETVLDVAGQGQVMVQHGAIVVATGGEDVKPTSYLYGQDERVMTQVDFERALGRGELRIVDGESRVGDRVAPFESVVMIQCVESRDERRPYCSRICCSMAVKNALKIKEVSPQTQVTVLYRDIRTYGFKEHYYRLAREQGVVFQRYDADAPPEVSVAGGRLRVEVDSEVGPLRLSPDLLLLSAGIAPRSENAGLAQLLKVPLNADGFFLEAHTKLRPLDFSADGIYLCGLAHSPKFVGEAMAQANGAAIRAVALLSQERIQAPGIVARVNERLCSGCGLCVTVCPYGARVLNTERLVAEVIDVLCQGCGACAVVCPNKATQQNVFEHRPVMAMIDEALA